MSVTEEGTHLFSLIITMEKDGKSENNISESDNKRDRKQSGSSQNRCKAQQKKPDGRYLLSNL